MNNIFTDEEIEQMKNRKRALRHHRKVDLHARLYGMSEVELMSFPVNEVFPTERKDKPATEIKPQYKLSDVHHDFESLYEDKLREFQKEWNEQYEEALAKILFGDYNPNEGIKYEDDMVTFQGKECIAVKGDKENIEYLIELWIERGFKVQTGYDRWLSDDNNYLHLECDGSMKVHNHRESVQDRNLYDADVESDWEYVTALNPEDSIKKKKKPVNNGSPSELTISDNYSNNSRVISSNNKSNKKLLLL